jgi:hypothetical protein
LTKEPWRAAVSRWGDPIWQLALLYHNDPKVACATTVRTFEQAISTTPANSEHALYRALLQQRQRRWRLARQSVLPRELARIAPNERVLLALWLIQKVDGPNLANISGLQSDVLITRMSNALLRVLPRHDLAHSPAGRAAMNAWLRQQLGFSTPIEQPNSKWEAAQLDWQATLEQIRDGIHTTIGKQHLPPACRDDIEDALTRKPEDEDRWWQRHAGLLSVLGILLVLLLIMVKPWQQTAPPAAAATEPSPQEIVEETLETWTTQPVSGTLHRRVWAVNERLPNTPVLVTELWLQADSPRHRVQVHKDGSLVEWQIGDGTKQLSHAAEPMYSSCQWQDPMVLDRIMRMYPATPEEQRIARDARLTLGAYGQGYHFLRTALAAPDLRSLGTQYTDETPVVLLSYTDAHTPTPRRLLLSIDPWEHQLRSVRELSGEGTQTTARELWRLEAHEILLTSASTTTPPWPPSRLERDRLVDPACPGLDEERVASLHNLVAYPFGLHLPTELPSDISRGALLSTTGITWDAYSPQSTRVILIGSDRWLMLYGPEYRSTYEIGGIQQGRWYVTLGEKQQQIIGSLCEPNRFEPDERWCMSSLQLIARGWTKDELLALIDTLAPVSPQTWIALDDIFLNPQPLSSEVKAVLADTFAAIHLPSEGILHTTAEYHKRVNPHRPERQDPYFVPPAIADPEDYTREEWLDISSTETRRKAITSTPDGTVTGVEINDGARNLYYMRSHGILVTDDTGSWWSDRLPITQGDWMLQRLLNTASPITLTESDNSWLLEQSSTISLPSSELNMSRYMTGTIPWANDLSSGTIVQRVWVDKRTALPQQTELVHVDAQGKTTLLEATRLTEWRWENDTPPDLFTLPPLPDDTITVDWHNDNLSEASLDLQPPSRVLMWPDTTGITVETDSDARSSLDALSQPNARLMQALSMSLEELDSLGVLKVTTYRMPPGDWRVTIRQGSRGLLRHILKYQSHYGRFDSASAWTSSEPVEVSIARQSHTAWLLEGSTNSALVMEIDDLLLHISSTSTSYLKGTVLMQLPNLEWVEVEAED